MTLLNQFSRETFFSAENGQPGENNNRSGKKGQDLEITLPIGTEIKDLKTGKIILHLNKKDTFIKLLNGGDGGLGNFEFRSARNTTPMYAQDGQPGEILEASLDLKLIADFGLIGLPNTGKSSLLNELTGAKAKTANYAFTTLSPNLGVFESHIIADIPGLIEGASGGKGLGIGFLKHIEKVKILIHCIDATSDDYNRDYKTVRAEISKFNKELLNKKEIILLTKSDLIESETKFKKAFLISVYDFESIKKIKKILSQSLSNNVK